MTDDEKYIARKKTDRVDFSKEFMAHGTQGARYVSRVLESGERDSFVKIEDEIVLRRTPSGKQQIKAFFLVDDRDIRTLTLQRFRHRS